MPIDYKKFREFLVRQRDDCIARAERLTTWIEWMDSLPPEAFEPAPDVNDERGQYIFNEFIRGGPEERIKMCVIRARANANPRWRPLRSDAEARNAMTRWCRRHGITPPRR